MSNGRRLSIGFGGLVLSQGSLSLCVQWTPTGLFCHGFGLKGLEGLEGNRKALGSCTR